MLANNEDHRILQDQIEYLQNCLYEKNEEMNEILEMKNIQEQEMNEIINWNIDKYET